MAESDGLIAGFVLDREGGGRRIEWSDARAWAREQGVLWLHLDRLSAAAQRWLTEESGLSAITCQALLEEDTRPRTTPMPDGLLVILRGVNLNPGAEPDEMISIRVWIGEDRVISLRAFQMQSVEAIKQRIDADRGPRTPGELIVQLAEELTQRIANAVSILDDNVAALEEQIITDIDRVDRHQVVDFQAQAVHMRRHVGPQRDALAEFSKIEAPWMTKDLRARLRETVEGSMRVGEDLAALKERAALVMAELSEQTAAQMNRAMYLLSIVAGIFLPLGFLTGLLGINVAGMPGADASATWAFWIVCGMLAVIAGIQVVLFRIWRML